MGETIKLSIYGYMRYCIVLQVYMRRFPRELSSQRRQSIITIASNKVPPNTHIVTINT